MNVAITDHAKEKVDGENKSRCSLPDSIIKNIVARRKGDFYIDRRDEGLIRQIYNRTVFVLSTESEDMDFIVVTVWRGDNPRALHSKSNRFEKVNIDYHIDSEPVVRA